MMSESADISSVDGFIKQAEAARQRQAWDDAIKVYQVALRQAAEDPRLRLGLAQSYEAKARQIGLKPLFLVALQEYWRLVNANPADVKAVDGLLAVAFNAGQLPEVMEEFRDRIKKYPEIGSYRTIFKKIETLFLFSAEPRKTMAAGPRGAIHTILGRVLPFVALACLLGWVVVQMKAGKTPAAELPVAVRVLQAIFAKFGIFSIVAYGVYQTHLRLRSSR